MYEYPSIPGPSKAPHKPCMGFVKYDGSNLRGEWTPKRGFHKFGTRDRRFDHSDKDFGPSIPIFMESLAEPLEQIFKRSNLKNNTFRGLNKPLDAKNISLKQLESGIGHENQ